MLTPQLSTPTNAAERSGAVRIATSPLAPAPSKRLRRAPLTPAQYAALVTTTSCSQPRDATAHGVFVTRQVRLNATHCADDPLSMPRYVPKRAMYSEYVRNHVDWSALATTLAQRRQRLQFPPRSTCSARQEVWEVAKFARAGYAFNVHNLVTFFGRHWDLNAPVIVGNARYRYSSGAPQCGGLGWSCLLSPHSSCAIEDLPPAKVVVRHRYAKSLPELCKPGGAYNISTGRCACGAGRFPYTTSAAGCARCAELGAEHAEGEEDEGEFRAKLRRCLDAEATFRRYEAGGVLTADARRMVYDAAPGGVTAPGDGFDSMHSGRAPASLVDTMTFFWWHAQHLWLMLRDAPLRPALDSYAASLKLGDSCLAVHVRHGDSILDASRQLKAHGWSAYAGAIRELEEEYGAFERIFLATDDGDIAAAAQRALPASRLVMQALDRSKFTLGAAGDADVKTIDDAAHFDSQDAIMDVAKDIWAMSTCAAFVGTLSSSVGWTVVELQAARRGHYNPFISLDIAYNDGTDTLREGVGRFTIDEDIGWLN